MDVGISRTDPLISCREVEQLHLDLIAAAREFLYIENQYLTSALIVDALSRRLQEADGPEIVMVLPLNNHGWLEDHTVEVLRFRQVTAASRSRPFWTIEDLLSHRAGPESEDESIVVHSKILVADDRLFRVGSANLTDRSMRLDTECDLTIEATDERQQTAIARLRNRLLGEHLGLSDGSGAGTAGTRSLAYPADRFVLEPVEVPARVAGGRQARPRSSATALIDPPQPLTPAFVIRTIATSAARSKWFWVHRGYRRRDVAVANDLRPRDLDSSEHRADGPRRRAPADRSERSNSERESQD